MSYTKAEAAKLSDLTPRNIQYYTERNVVEPEVEPGQGKGSTRLYSRKNIIELRIIKSLIDYRMDFSTVKTILSFLQQKSGFDVPETLEGINTPLIERLQKGRWLLVLRHANGLSISLSVEPTIGASRNDVKSFMGISLDYILSGL